MQIFETILIESVRNRNYREISIQTSIRNRKDLNNALFPCNAKKCAAIKPNLNFVLPRVKQMAGVPLPT